MTIGARPQYVKCAHMEDLRLRRWRPGFVTAARSTASPRVTRNRQGAACQRIARIAILLFCIHFHNNTVKLSTWGSQESVAVCRAWSCCCDGLPPSRP